MDTDISNSRPSNTSITKTSISSLYKQNFLKLYKFFYFKILSKEIAEDLTTETFLLYVETVEKNSKVDDPKAFLFGIAKNVFLKFLREKYTHETSSANLGESFDEYLDNFVKVSESGRDLTDILEKFLPKIPAKQREIASMRFVDKLSLKEIAEKLGKDMNYVKTTQKRAIASIKKLIATEGTE